MTKQAAISPLSKADLGHELGLKPAELADHEIRHFPRRLSRTAGHVKDRALVGMRVARRNNDDLQWQFPACSGPAIFEDIVNSAAQFLLNAVDVTGRECYTGSGESGRRRTFRGECSPKGRDGSQRENESEQLSRKNPISADLPKVKTGIQPNGWS